MIILLTNQAFETNYRRARAQQDMAQMTAADEKKLQNQVLDQMITNEVTVQSARKYGFEVSLNKLMLQFLIFLNFRKMVIFQLKNISKH